MATVTIEYGEGEHGVLECYHDVDMEIIEQIQKLLGCEISENLGRAVVLGDDIGTNR